MGGIFIITGEIQSGKTSLCLEIAEIARDKGVQLGGLLSPGVFLEGVKVAIDALDLKTGKLVRLADSVDQGAGPLTTKRYAFYPKAVAWGNQVLEDAVPCELLLVDELGPLEFNRGQGWVKGFKAVASGDYRAALLVIRPSLLEEALSRWEVDRIYDLDDPNHSRLSGEAILRSLIENL
jgi:nucleoside-triphosphatase THEP1